jgi:hypothetical protein
MHCNVQITHNLFKTFRHKHCKIAFRKILMTKKDFGSVINNNNNNIVLI